MLPRQCRHLGNAKNRPERGKVFPWKMSLRKSGQLKRTGPRTSGGRNSFNGSLRIGMRLHPVVRFRLLLVATQPPDPACRLPGGNSPPGPQHQSSAQSCSGGHAWQRRWQHISPNPHSQPLNGFTTAHDRSGAGNSAIANPQSRPMPQTACWSRWVASSPNWCWLQPRWFG